MKAVYYEEFGGADVLKVGERPMPKIEPNEVLVQMAAASINPIDRRLRGGELQDFFQREWPITPGWDMSGRIAKVGDDVKDWKEGDDIIGLAFNWKLGNGTNAEYAPVAADSITAKPKNATFSQAACIPLVGLTAWQSLFEYGEVKEGQKVFIQAGAGGLGNIAIQLAKHAGAHVYTTSREANHAYLKSLGADEVIDYTKEDYFSIMQEKEPDGVDVVLELLLNNTVVANAIHMAKKNGCVVYMNNEPPDMREIAWKNIKTQFFHHQADGATLTKLVELYENGTLKYPEIQEISMDELADAHKKSEQGGVPGKVVLKIADL